MAETPFFGDRSSSDFTRHLAQVLMSGLLKSHSLALRDGTAKGNSANIAMSAIIAIVRPTVELIYESQAECLRGITISPITQHLIDAHVLQNPTQSREDSSTDLVARLSALSLESAVRKILVASDPDLEEMSGSPVAMIAARSIMIRAADISPLTEVILRTQSADIFFQTAGGAVLVRRSGEKDIDEVDPDEASSVAWEKLSPYRPTQADLDAAREFVAGDAIKVKGGKTYDVRGGGRREITSDDERKSIELDPEGTGSFKVARAGVAADAERLASGVVSEVSQTSIAVRDPRSGQISHVGVSEVANILQPRAAEFAFLPMDETLSRSVERLLEAEIAPAFTAGGAQDDKIRSLTRKFVLAGETSQGLKYQAAKPGQET